MFYKKPKQNTPPPSTILSSKWEPPAYVAVALGKTLLLHRPASLSCISIHYLSWQRWAGLKIQSCLHQAEGQAVQCVRVWAPQLWTCQAKSRVLHGPLIFFFFFRTKRTLKGLMGFIYLPTANTGSEGIAERKECLGQEGQRPHLPCWLWPWQSPCGRRSMSFFTWFQDLSRLESASMVTISFLLLRILERGRLAGCWTLQY